MEILYYENSLRNKEERENMSFHIESVNQKGELVVCCNIISQDDFERINEVCHTIFEALTEADYCCMVLDNIADFVTDCQCNGPGIEKSFIKCNRYFLNWLNAFYAWIEYHERYFQPEFKTIKGYFFDQYFEYRLAYHLRKYITHCALPIEVITFDVLKEQVLFQIFPSRLLKENPHRLTRKDLEAIEKEERQIDAVQFTLDFVEMFKVMQLSLWDLRKTQLEKYLEYMKSFVPQTVPECYTCRLISDDGSIDIAIGKTMENFMKKQNYISKYFNDYNQNIKR